jgi:hypothetical protein
MIKKIISGGQTGANQAALDTAMKCGIPHGGWIPKGRPTGKGPLSEKYQLKEMATEGYLKPTEQNVLDADGTLIISRGELTGGSALTKQLAMKHGKPFFHVDMNRFNVFKAARRIHKWIGSQSIKVLNVAGPRASHDPGIYPVAVKVLETLLALDLISTNVHDLSTDFLSVKEQAKRLLLPRTTNEAVERLCSRMSLKSKVDLANLTEEDLFGLDRTLGAYIREEFGLLGENSHLRQSCRLASGGKAVHEDDASAFIIKELWKKLKRTHRLKIAK